MAVVECGQPLVMTETEIPALTGTQVLIQNEFAGMCHSDLHLWEGTSRHICSRAGALPARALTCPRVADKARSEDSKSTTPVRLLYVLSH